MKKVIVTGANGFLGKNIVMKLSNNGYYVYAVVHSYDISLKDVTNCKCIVLENKSLIDLQDILYNEKIDIFFHFAWEGTSGSLRGDYKTQVNNILLTCDAVETARELKCKRFVFCESVMEYEIQKAIMDDEDLSINTVYSVAKLSANYIAKILCQNNNIEYVGLLVSNIFGPGEKSERLINLTIRKLLKNEHCSFSSGEQIYDFIYIDDAINMIYLASVYGKKNNSYYIGNIEQRKLKDFLIDLRDVVCKNAKLGFGELPNPKTVINFDEFDTQKIYNEFNYVCKIDFKTGIKNTLEYIIGD